MNRILIIQTAFLGDVILATAAIEQARITFPHSKIYMLVKKGNESLLNNNPHLEGILVFDKKKQKVKELFRLIQEIRSLKFDVVVNFHRFASSGILAGFSGAKHRIGFKKNPFSFLYTKSYPHTIGDGTHEVSRNLQLLSDFETQLTAKPKLYPSTKEKQKINGIVKGPYYCIAPASVWFTKQLPEHKWVELIKLIPQDSIIYLIGGKDDVVFCTKIINNVQQGNVINLAGQLSLLDSAELISRAKRSFVNDSGPLHIASAMNAPVTSFFCSTVQNFGFGPLSDDSQVLEVSNLDCKPCGLHGFKECPKGHFKCGEINLTEAQL